MPRINLKDEAHKTLLKTVKLASPSPTLSFSSSDVPNSGYTDLELIIWGRSSGAVTRDALRVAFNGDVSDSNYASRQLISDSTPSATSVTARGAGLITGASSAAGYVGLTKIVIPHYLSTDFFHLLRAHALAGSEVSGNHTPAHLGVTTWKSTAAISTVDISLLAASAQFVSGTTARLYGVI